MLAKLTCACTFFKLTLLLLVSFSYKLMHHLKPFAIVVLNGEITVYRVDSPNGFECTVGQLIQYLAWILRSGESMDPQNHLNGFEWQFSLLTTLFKWYHHMCTKPMGIFHVHVCTVNVHCTVHCTTCTCTCT